MHVVGNLAPMTANYVFPSGWLACLGNVVAMYSAVCIHHNRTPLCPRRPLKVYNTITGVGRVLHYLLTGCLVSLVLGIGGVASTCFLGNWFALVSMGLVMVRFLFSVFIIFGIMSQLLYIPPYFIVKDDQTSGPENETSPTSEEQEEDEKPAISWSENGSGDTMSPDVVDVESARDTESVKKNRSKRVTLRNDWPENSLAAVVGLATLVVVLDCGLWNLSKAIREDIHIGWVQSLMPLLTVMSLGFGWMRFSLSQLGDDEQAEKEENASRWRKFLRFVAYFLFIKLILTTLSADQFVAAATEAMAGAIPVFDGWGYEQIMSGWLIFGGWMAVSFLPLFAF